MGLEVKSEDVYELLKSHEIELNMEEMQHLQEEKQGAIKHSTSGRSREVIFFG